MKKPLLSELTLTEKISQLLMIAQGQLMMTKELDENGERVRRSYEEIDEIMTRHSNGWKVSRITPVSRSAIRLCIFEMKYMDDIPSAVSINEAIELVKTYDDPKMRTFVNGVLHGAKTELEAAAQ